MNIKLVYVLLPFVFSRCLALVDEPARLNSQLFFSARVGSTNFLEILIDRGADVNAQDGYGFTALHYAAHFGQLESLLFLLSSHADPNILNHEGLTALHYAAGDGRIDCVEALLQAKADLNARGQYAGTPLHSAALHGHSSCIKALIEAKADVGACDGNGSTALRLAARNGHIDCVKQLVKYSYLLIPSKQAVSASRRRIFNALLLFVRLRNHYKKLDNLKSASLQFEILSSHKLLRDDLVIILLDELKRGREIKGTALIRSKENAVNYFLKKIEEMVPLSDFSVLTSAMRALFDPAKLKENFGPLLRESLDERFEELKIMD